MEVWIAACVAFMLIVQVLTFLCVAAICGHTQKIEKKMRQLTWSNKLH